MQNSILIYTSLGRKHLISTSFPEVYAIETKCYEHVLQQFYNSDIKVMEYHSLIFKIAYLQRL